MKDRWICPACDEQFRLLSLLIDHVKLVHAEDERTLRLVGEYEEAAG